jgi:hypothetical protein
MRSIINARVSLVLSLLACSLPVRAVTPHPTDSSATLIAVDTVWWNLPSSTDPPLLVASNEGATRHVVVVWRSSTGRVDYVLDANSFDQGDSSAGLDSLTTPSVFDRITHATMLRGSAVGYADSTADSLSPGHSWVFVPACVERTGSGSTTEITSCSVLWSRRIVTYFVASDDQLAITIHSSASTTSCSQSYSLCESTTLDEPLISLE